MGRIILTLIIGLLLAACSPSDVETQLAPKDTIRETNTTKPKAPTSSSIIQPSQTPTTQPPTACVTVDKLNVRSGPGTTFSVVTGLTRGECVELQETSADNKWFRYEKGWIFAEYTEVKGSTSLVTSSTAAPTIEIVPTKTRVAPVRVVPILPATSIPEPTNPPAPPQVSDNCDPSYPGVCIPPPPPDLDCKDISFRRFRVVGADPHHFDGDGDGIGCE
jgi:uncharacterized protein YraI